MHIALLSGEYPPDPGGLGDYTHCLASALIEQGLVVSIITLRAGALLALKPQPHPQVLLSQPLRGWSWQLWPALIGLLDGLRPEVLHLQYQTGAYAMHPALNFLPWRLRGLTHRPALIVTFHDVLEPYLFPKAGPLRSYVNRRLARDADAVVVTNPADEDALAHAVSPPPQRIPIGSNIAPAPLPGYDREAWRAKFGVTTDETLLAYFGLLSPSKGVDDLITTLAALPPSVRLLLIGGAASSAVDRAYSDSFAVSLRAAGLEDRVIRTGHVSPELVSAHLRAADIVVLPFHDGASLRRGSLLAAMAHGCCVLSTRPVDTATQALLRHGVQLFLVDQAAELPTAIFTLMHDPLLRSQLGAAARTFVQQFSWQRIAASHLKLYRRTLVG